MKSRIKNLTITPSWLIMCTDFLVVLFGTYLALVIRDNFNFKSSLYPPDYIIVPIIIVCIRCSFFLIFKTHRIVVRYTNTKDVSTIFLSCFAGTVFMGVLNIISFAVSHHFLIPTSVLLMEFFITTLLLIFYKFVFKIYYLKSLNPDKFKKNIVIFGAGEAGITTKRALDRDTKSKYNVLAFIDDDNKKIGMYLESLPVISSQGLNAFLQKNNISFLIIAIQNFPPEKLKAVTEIALPHNVKVLIVPPVTKWINGELSFKQIKKVKIEDLLERAPIQIDNKFINADIKGKTILITGAAGSIGSEIVRQVIKFGFKQLVLIDNAETPTFYLQNECYAVNRLKNIDIIIADVCDAFMMESIMQQYKPDLIYHAAAYKHVPMMENNVQAAIKVNVNGTKLLADTAVRNNVAKFVMVSTDKAVNPTNVMGASKRIAEIYVQALNFHQSTTRFITTRFGNVLGSNGSVIPTFRKQIENGGPVTVTHPDITRYFMTIPEACQLVIIAGAMGNGGEIFIFDMGESVKIVDLAKKMIQLSGLTLGKDITIEFTGLRPGEKLYEELLANQENTVKTTHQKIMIANVRTYSYETIAHNITELIRLKNDNPYTIVKKMKEMVPEFISQNSDFEINN